MHDTTLDHLFAKYNYGVVETDCPFLDIYLHTKDPVCTPVVVIIDAEAAAAVKAADTRYEEKDRIRAGEPYTLNAENIAMISDQLQQMLIDNNFDNCEYLYILMTEDDSLGRKLFPDRKNYWQIIPSQGILQAYEDVDTLFSPLIRSACHAQRFCDTLTGCCQHPAFCIWRSDPRQKRRSVFYGSTKRRTRL